MLQQRISKKTSRDSNNPLHNVDVIILCGGQGNRLKTVINNQPKVLAEINNKPLLDITLDFLSAHGLRRIILAVGHMKDIIKERYKERGVEFSEEEIPLGTGGAIKKAEPLIQSDNFLVMNGDCLWKDINFQDFYNFHISKDSFVSIMATQPAGEHDYGVILLNNSRRIKSFKEKNDDKNREYLISMGIYLMRRDIFAYMPNSSFSLEYDFFPKILKQKCYAFDTKARFIDIGTPGRYKSAANFF